jgi:hypothetical protein
MIAEDTVDARNIGHDHFGILIFQSLASVEERLNEHGGILAGFAHVIVEIAFGPAQ